MLKELKSKYDNDNPEGAPNTLYHYCSNYVLHKIITNREIFDDAFDFFRLYSFCLSEKNDLLSQWRGYSDAGHGAAIGFNRDWIEDNLCNEGDEGCQKLLHGPPACILFQGANKGRRKTI